MLDPAGGVFLALIAVVGFASAAMSPSICATRAAAGSAARRSHAWYYAAFNLFWAVLLALPLADNLAVAWLLIEATTAASALLVAFSGKRSALEAGWKYVVLTTLGLAVALLGIVVLFAAVGSAGRAQPPRLAGARPTGRQVADGGDAGRLRPDLGRAGKQDRLGSGAQLAARRAQRGPPPVSAMLSAALLPTVLLIAWRTELGARAGPRGRCHAAALHRLRPRLPAGRRPLPLAALPWKRLLAYSSLEHMGILALGIGFGTPTGDRRRRRSRRRPRHRQGARLLRRDPAAAPGPRARRGGPGRRRTSTSTAAAMSRESRSRSPACRPRPSSSPR